MTLSSTGAGARKARAASLHAGGIRRGRERDRPSLIAAGRSLIVENNYGYTAPAVEGGRADRAGPQAHRRPRASAAGDLDEQGDRALGRAEGLAARPGLVYTYTTGSADGTTPGTSPRSTSAPGKTVFKRLRRRGLGFNNNYAPVTIGPDGTAYSGTLGGLVRSRGSALAGGAALRAKGLPSESLQIAQRSPGWITEPPSSPTRVTAASRSGTLK